LRLIAGWLFEWRAGTPQAPNDSHIQKRRTAGIDSHEDG
jgi:hypothetical protein